MNAEELRERRRLERVVEKLDRDLDAVVVEGFSDRRVVRDLGFEGRVFMSAERTLEDLVEDVSRGASRVGVLTDFDNHGKEEAETISRALQSEVDVIRSARKEFGEALLERNRRAVEDIAPLLENRWKKFTDATLHRLF